MKLTLVFILLCCLHVSARVFSQTTITLKLQTTDLKKALAIIERKSDYRFLYNDASIPAGIKVDVNANKTPVTVVLDEILADKALSYKILDNNLIVITAKNVLILETSVNGKITSSTGEVLQGVSIKIKGSNLGTQSDAMGNFDITVPDNAILIISYVGYETIETPVNGRTTINVSLLPSTKVLDQVVVVGYGTQRRRDVTGATATVKGAELSKQPVTNAAQALQGKVAGVQIVSSGQPGTSPQILIRGTNTALAGAAVLFVVDGVLTDDISNINTADIVNMDILKDASATAIYGSRGANGVIIITTKKGVTGKPKVSYNANVGIRQAADLVTMANGTEYANYASSASGLPISAGAISTDWYKTILRTAVEQNHNVSLSGGTDNATYFLSVGYLVDQGIVIDNLFKRFTIRSNNDFKITNKIKVGTQVSYSNGNDQRVNLGTAYNDAYRAAPIIPGKVNGKYGNTSSYQNVGNPILDIENNKNPVINNRIQGAAYIEYKPVQWLSFRSSVGGDLINDNNKTYNYKFLNDTTSFLTFGGNQRNPNSNLSITSSKTFRWVWDNTVTFSKRIDRHTITVLAGTTAEKYTNEYIQASVKDVPADPNLWYIGTGNANTAQNSGSGDKWARNAYIGRINYSYNDRYLFTGTIRADGSSRFPSQNRWGYFPSLGVGWIISKEDFMQNQKIFDNLKLRGSWGRVGNDNIPSDAFVVTVSPNLAYPFTGATATPGSAITRIKDPNIKWETTSEADIALEFSSFKNRLTGEINYYDKKVNDALIFVKIPAVAGDQTGQVLTNAASIQNKGVEISLNWTDKINNNISYHIGGNITLNRNNVIGLNGGQPIFDGGVSQSNTTKTDNGHAVGSFYVLKMIGIFQSDAEVTNYKNPDGTQIQPGAHAGDIKYEKAPVPGKNPTGAIDPVNDLQFVGSYQPKAYYGINLGISYKNFDLSVDGYGNAGNQVYNGKKAFRRSDGNVDNIERYQAYDRWTLSNQSQTEPAANKGLLPNSTYFLESGSFIRINNMTLGYALPAHLLEKIKISNLRVFLTSQNLYTYKKYSGFTAELPGSPTASGIELNAYPTTRTFAFGVNVGF